MTVGNIFTIIFLSLGFLCFVSAAVGVFKFPDFFNRMHAAGIGESCGLLLCTIGFIIHQGLNITGLKIFIILLAVFISSPIGTHIIVKVAYQNKGAKDKIKEKEEAV